MLDKRLALAGDLLLDQITRTLQRQALAHSTEQLQFRIAALGSDAALLGAGLIILDALFEVPALKPPRFLLDRSLQAKARRSARRRTSAEPPNELEVTLTPVNGLPATPGPQTRPDRSRALHLDQNSRRSRHPHRTRGRAIRGWPRRAPWSIRTRTS